MVERSRTDREVEVLLQARSVTVDLNGVFWVYHGLQGIAREPQAAAVTALRADGATRTYLASEILPPGAVLPGTVGQVYAIAPLTTPGFYAASAGWLDADHNTVNGVVFFREDARGQVTTFSIVRMARPRAVAAGPKDTAIVAALDPLQNGDTYLATVINAQGTVLTELCPFNEDDLRTRMDRISSVRFHSLSGDSVAIFNPVSARVEAHRIFTPERCGFEEAVASDKPRSPAANPRVRFTSTPLWSCSVSDVSDIDASEILPITGFAASPDAGVTVVRGAIIEDQPRTVVTRYIPGERLPSWVSDHFWRAVLVTPRNVRGLVAGQTIWEEQVHLAGE